MSAITPESGKRPDRPDTSAEMLAQEPPPEVVVLMAWLLIALFLTGLVVSVTVRFPEAAHCRFILISERGTDPIQSRLTAVVHQVNVTEGQEVEEGETLFVLRSDEIRGWQTQLQSAQEDSRALQNRAKKLDELFMAQMAIKDQEMQQMAREVSFRAKHTATSKDFLARNEKLASERLISTVDLLHHQLLLDESEKDFQVAERSAQQVALQRQQLETDRTRQRLDEESDLQKLRLRITALQRQLENCQGELMLVRAPYRGVVVSMPLRNSGSVVVNGQELCQLARVEGCLSARLQLPEEALPHLVVGQPVKLFFNAFPYQRYGSQSGRLDWISPAPVSSAGGAKFIARASVEPKAGRQLRVGMEGEARIIVGRRTLIEYAFEPIRRLREQSRP